MDMAAHRNIIAQRLARAMIEGFNAHYRRFRACSAQAKARFEAADWQGVQQSVRDRIGYYDDRVNETVASLHEEFKSDLLDEAVWQPAKLFYIGLLTEHKQPELAETFFNTVFCRIMRRTYFHNDFIFVRPAISTEYIESDPPTYRSYYPTREGLRASIRRVFLDFGWQREFENLDRDIEYILSSAARDIGGRPQAEANFQIQVVTTQVGRNSIATPGLRKGSESR